MLDHLKDSFQQRVSLKQTDFKNLRDYRICINFKQRKSLILDVLTRRNIQLLAANGQLTLIIDQIENEGYNSDAY